MITTLKDAEAIAGTLGSPSKMPGYAYGLPAVECKVGALLRKLPGSTCSDCYALKGRYLFGNVKTAQYRRLHSLKHPQWVEALVFMIRRRRCDYFRWHDSGDLQDMDHLNKIVEVAQLCPETRFWLPTRENHLISQFLAVFGGFPSNLLVRVSAAMIDGAPPVRFPHTSTVVKLNGEPSCPAPKQGGVCGACRACWDPTVANVSYHQH